ncbi:aldo/keto reductase [Candidatus Curtissbacteria bacterium]|nr:aldo/keto reductase [Candidatus Curtissbacteria bacterium]
MEFKILPSGKKIPVLGLGTWRMGGQLWRDTSQDEKYIDAIQYAVKRGITHIDTAEIYGAGHTEEIVGEAIKQFDRQKLFLSTKVSPQHIFLPRQIKRSCQNSLNRLQVEYIDLYLIHWPNPLAPMKMVMAAFDELVSDGKIRYIGVSNFSVRQLTNAQKYVKNKIVTNQVHYSLLHRDPEEGLSEFCQKENVILTAYSPLEIGRIGSEEFKALTTVAQKYRKTPVQVALRYLLEKPNVIVIPKASTPEHIDELLGSLGWKMKPGDQEYLSQEF